MTNIIYGTVLGTNQDDATATVGGTFAYNPTNGVILPAGTNVLTAVFTPGDTNYAAANLTNTVVVTPASLKITADSTNKVYNTTLVLGAGQTAFTSVGLVNSETIGSVTLASGGHAARRRARRVRRIARRMCLRVASARQRYALHLYGKNPLGVPPLLARQRRQRRKRINRR